MTKHQTLQKRLKSKSKSKTMKRSQKGGELAGNPPSGWGWVQGTVGNGWTQFMNSLTVQPSENLGTIQSNDVVPVNNINAQDRQGMIGPLANQQLSGLKPPHHKGGKKTKTRKGGNKNKKGGSLATILGQAVVPFSLLGLQQLYGPRRPKHHKYNKYNK
jgi:hypothetical protein